MRTSRLFKKSALLAAIIACVVVLSVTAIAGIALLTASQYYDLGVDFCGATVSTNGKVNINFLYQYDTDPETFQADKFVAEISDPSGSGNASSIDRYAVELEEKTIGGETYRRMTVPLAPSQMTYNVTVYAVNEDGSKQTKPVTYSVREYADQILADPGLADYHDAMRAMLNWGAMAQEFFHEAEANPANEGVFVRDTNPVNAVSKIADSAASATDGKNIDITSCELHLDKKDVYLKVNFTCPSDKDVIFASVYRDGFDQAEGMTVQPDPENGGYYVKISNISVNLYDKEYEVTITVDDWSSGERVEADTAVFNGSVLQYLNALLSDNKAENDNVAKAMYQFYQAATGNTGAENCSHNAEIYWVSNGDGTDSYHCSACLLQYDGIKVPQSAEYFFTAYDIAKPQAGYVNANKYYPRSDYNIRKSVTLGELSYATISGKDGNASELHWQRMRHDVAYAQTSSANQQYTVDVGNAKYVVLKIRSNHTNAMYFEMSTTGKNSPTLTVTEEWLIEKKLIDTNDDGTPKKNEDGSYVYISNFQYDINGQKYLTPGDQVYTSGCIQGIIIPNAIEAADENGFVTYVINLANVAPNHYVKDGDSYVIDTLYFHFEKFAADTNVDISYMTFAENWEEIKTIAGQDTVIQIGATDGKVYGEVYTEDGSCVAHKNAVSHVENNGVREYAYECTLCGTKHITGVNWISKTNEMGIHGNSADGVTSNIQKSLSEDGVTYSRFNSAKGTHLNTTGTSSGNGKTTAYSVSRGDFMVVKYRSSVSFDVSISNTGTTRDAHGSLSATGYNATTGENSGWRVAVIDLRGGTKYVAGTDGTIDMMFLSAGKGVTDISYVALVDTHDEARALISVIGADEVYYDYGTTATNASCTVNVSDGAYTSHGKYAIQAVDGACMNVCQTCKAVGDPADHTATFKTVDGKYVETCDRCGYVKYEYGITAAAANRFLTPANIRDWGGKASGSGTVTFDRNVESDEDGLSYVRMTNIRDNTPSGSWVQWGTGISGISGQYMVMKFRLGNNGLSQTSIQMYIPSHYSLNKDPSGNALTENLNENAVENYGYAGIKIKATEDNQWHVVVIDLSQRVAAGGFAANPDGTYSVQSLNIRPFTNVTAAQSDDYLDIAYIAFCDTREEISGLVKEETYEWSVDDKTNGVCSTATRECVGNEHKPKKVAIGYDYRCLNCGKSYSMNLWYNEVGVYQPANNGTVTSMHDDEGGFDYKHVEITGSAALTNWTASSYTGAQYVPSYAGRYLVIKIRGTVPSGTIPFRISTENGGKGMSGKNPYNTTVAEFTSASISENDWSVVAIDLKDVEGYSVGTTTGISIRSASGDGGAISNGAEFDIAYVMIVDDLKDISEWEKETDITVYKTKLAENTKCHYDTRTEEYVGHYKVAETVDGNKHTLACTVCGTVVKEFTVADAINWYSPLSGMGAMNNSLLTKNVYDADNNIMYNRYKGSAPAHLNITGGGGAGTWTADKFATGNYVVMKYRASMASVLNFNVSTKDNGANTSYSDGRPAYSSIYSLPVSKSIDINDEDAWKNGWRVIVIQIPDGKNYTKNSEQEIYFMFTTNSGDWTLDISYMAVVDSLAEAEMLLESGETYTWVDVTAGTAGVELNPDTGRCAAGCTYPTGVDRTKAYTLTCSKCKTVAYDFDVDTSKALRYRYDFQLVHYTNICNCAAHQNGTTADCIAVDNIREYGSPIYARVTVNPDISKPESNPIHGRGFLGDTSNNPVDNVNYLVFKFRVGENGLGQENMRFYFSQEKEEHTFSVNVSEDNQWHTIVVDLKAVIGDGTKYTGTYTISWFRLFGNMQASYILENNPDAYVDVAYAAGCETLSDAAALIDVDTFEWVNTDGSVEVRNVSTLVEPAN